MSKYLNRALKNAINGKFKEMRNPVNKTTAIFINLSLHNIYN